MYQFFPKKKQSTDLQIKRKVSKTLPKEFLLPPVFKNNIIIKQTVPESES